MTDEFVDNAYKTGAGRYLQERGALASLGAEVALLGSRAFVIGGPHSYAIVRDAAEASLSAASVPFEFACYEKLPTRTDMQALAEAAAAFGADVVVGIGGGRAMDAAKAVAFIGGLPVVEAPTSIATCAAFSPLSVMYHEDGSPDGVWRFTREVDAVVVDMDVMATQPARLVAAGVLDAMAKMIEIENGGAGLDCEKESAQRFAAYQYARVNYKLLQRYALQACQDVVAGKVTDALEKVTFTNIVLTGIVSSLTRGFHQTAHAHRLYDFLRGTFGPEVRPYLHGELVAVGLLMQLVYNGSPEKTDELRAFMRAMDMPTSLEEMGVSATDKRFAVLYDLMSHTEFVGEGILWHDRLDQAFDEIITRK